MQVVMVPAAGPDDHAIIPRVQTRQASLPMPRLPYVPLDIAEPKEVVDAVRARRGGTLLNLDRILLHSPPVAMGWNHLLGAVRRDLTLSPKLRELAMCVVAVLNGAEYEWGHHAPLFVEAGGTDAQLAAMRDPQGASRDPVLFDAAERADLPSPETVSFGEERLLRRGRGSARAFIRGALHLRETPGPFAARVSSAPAPLTRSARPNSTPRRTLFLPP